MSPLASVSSEAKIGQNVIIEPFATIYGDVEIGDGTWIGPNSVVMDGARIGKNCKVFPTAVISAPSQDLKYNGEYTTTEIGDGTILRECVTVHKGTTDRMKTVIGKNCLLMAYAHVAHDCVIGNNVIIANACGISGHITIDDFAILEGMVGAQQFVHVGTHSFVGGTSKIRKDVPPFVKVAKEPLSYIGINSVGLKRRGYSDESIRRIETIYKILFIQHKNLSKGIEKVQAEISDSPEKTIILDFIANSKNGLVKGFV
ncbi:MAG: acyl-ACP--UDP-N-acetylglucosamine O-acyltransferase [Flavobacteriales bacterium]|nr:acyl-ACP--UDP-N-acetylglucosamine O-acyltransferase [Flavobacteriales bacterium]